jgi:hypothetical protein
VSVVVVEEKSRGCTFTSTVRCVIDQESLLFGVENGFGCQHSFVTIASLVGSL